MRGARSTRCLTAGALALIGVLVVWQSCSAAVDPTARVIRYDHDTLTVRLHDVPLTEVLQELGKQSGAEIRGQVDASRTVTATFNAVPLPEALDRLLAEQDFALVYAKDGRLRTVRLVGGEAVIVPAATAPAPAERPPFPGGLPALMDAHPPVAVSGAVADVLGSATATLRQVFEMALHHPDAAVRAEAIRIGITTVEEERNLYVAVVDELEHTDSAVVAGLLRSAAAANAEDVATQVSQSAHAAQFKLMASSVRYRLSRGG